MNSILTLRPLLERAWSSQTTWCPENYQYKDKAWGQCGVTSLWLQQFYGATLMEGIAVVRLYRNSSSWSRHRHFWVRVHGVDVDLTARQFPVGTEVQQETETVPEALLTNGFFTSRYNTFKKRMEVK